MDTITLYTDAYGQTIRLRTYASDIASATCVLHWKILGGSTTASINGVIVVGDTDDEGDACYSVDYALANAFLTTKAGTWICQQVATYSTAVVPSDCMIVKVVARPTV